MSADPNGGYICKICGLAFVTEKAIAWIREAQIKAQIYIEHQNALDIHTYIHTYIR